METEFEYADGEKILKVLSYWNLNVLSLIICPLSIKLKVLSYWNLNQENIEDWSVRGFLKVLSYWNLNHLL